jgi:hypothetical protein
MPQTTGLPATARTFPGGGRKMLEDQPALDVLALHHAGGLVHGTVTTLRWPGSLEACVRADHGRLLVAIDDGLEVVLQVDYQAAASDRPHVRCPSCDRRVYRLYLLDGDRFRCRRCAGLAYAVRHERRWCPALQRVYKLRARLPGAELTPFGAISRPPGLRWNDKWYVRLVRQIRAAEAEVLEALRKTTAAAARLHRDE